MNSATVISIAVVDRLWSRADKARAAGIDAYLEFCQVLAELGNAGVTQQEIASRYGMSRSGIAQALCVGRDERIVSSANNSRLPRSEYILYQLTTLSDDDFKRFAKPDATREDIAEFKASRRTAKTKTSEPTKRGWPQCLVDLGIRHSRQINGSQRAPLKQKLEQQLGWEIPGYVTAEQESQIQNAYIAVFGDDRLNKDLARPTLPESQEKKVQRVIAVELRRLQDSFNEEVRKEAERRLPEMRARYERDSAACVAESTRYAAIIGGIKKKITVDEYKFLLGLLHPDKHSPEEHDRYSRGFQIVMRLRDYAEA